MIKINRKKKKNVFLREELSPLFCFNYAEKSSKAS